MVQDLNQNGKFLLNCGWTDQQLEQFLPDKMKKCIAEKNIDFYTIDGIKIGKEIGLGGRINTILQSAFFRIMNIIPCEKAVSLMKEAASKTYGRKGEKVVSMNHLAIDRGLTGLHKVNVPESWSKINVNEDSVNDIKDGDSKLLDYVNTIQEPVNECKGNELPVSAFVDHADGTVPLGSAAFEKRGVAIDVPEWTPENCIQCNFCSYVCPHAVVRPCVMTDEELSKAPKNTKSKK